MIVGGTIEIVFKDSSVHLALGTTPVLASGRMGGKTGKVGGKVAAKALPEVEKGQLPDWLRWAAKQKVGAGKYYLLNKWGRWENYTMRDAAGDWAMEKAIRLTIKVGKSTVNRVTTSPSPYQPFAAAPAAGGSLLALGGLSWMLGGGIILNAFAVSGGAEKWTWEADEFAAV